MEKEIASYIESLSLLKDSDPSSYLERLQELQNALTTFNSEISEILAESN